MKKYYIYYSNFTEEGPFDTFIEACNNVEWNFEKNLKAVNESFIKRTENIGEILYSYVEFGVAGFDIIRR